MKVFTSKRTSFQDLRPGDIIGSFHNYGLIEVRDHPKDPERVIMFLDNCTGTGYCEVVSHRSNWPDVSTCIAQA